MSKINTAFILSAGLGTRLRPITNDIPKALVQIHGKTLLERSIRYLAGFGITRFVVNVHHFADKIIDYLEENENFGYELLISDETEMILETGGGLKKAEEFLKNETFVMMNVDIITNLNLNEMINFYFNNPCISTLAVSNRKSSRKLVFDKDSKQLKGWVNKLTQETKGEFDISKCNLKAFSGIHILSPEIFSFLPEPDHAYSIVQPYIKMATEGKKILGFDHSGGLLIDVGKHDSLKQAENIVEV